MQVRPGKGDCMFEYGTKRRSMFARNGLKGGFLTLVLTLASAAGVVAVLYYVA